MDKVVLTLHCSKSKDSAEEKYYVVGDINELGNWQEKKQMKKVNRKHVVSNRK